MGICHQININKIANVTIEQVKQKLSEQMDLSLYNCEETDDDFNFVIKETVVLEQLHDFIQQQFSIYPGSNNEEDYKSVLKAIAGLNKLAEMIELAEERKFENFQQISMNDYVYADRWKQMQAEFSLFVFFVEGKIYLECCDSFLKYIENLVRSNSKHSISGAFRAYIE
jgi:hypothetical protein